jgi:hypothetical protein
VAGSPAMHAPRVRRPVLPLVGAIALVALLAGVTGLAVGVSGPAAAAPATSHSAAVLAPDVARPLNGSFNPPCSKINTLVCVSVANDTTPAIVPPNGATVAGVEPLQNTSIDLLVKSRYLLNQTNAPKNGPDSPIALNVTGRLWNGDPYSNANDSEVWHTNNNTFWFGPSNHTAQNRSYPWWYTVVLAGKGANGEQNFFAGETVTWWIYLSIQNGSNYQHYYSLPFRFTYGGAWPFSPYPGSQQYAGPNSTFADIAISTHPAAPNWNDSLTVVVNTTAADGYPTNATLGSVNMRFTEVYEGVTIVQTNFAFPITTNSSAGAETASQVIPAKYALLSEATVTYQIVVTDFYGDQLTAPVDQYTVGSNGTFLSGTFSDDIGVQSSPSSVAAGAGVAATLAPGEDVNLTITSLNTATAIEAAEIVEYFSYPEIGEKVVVDLPMLRVSSTIFTGTVPGAPLGSFVNFTIDAWDFAQHQLVSTPYSFVTPTFASWVPFVPGNASFFYVYVYDNGSHEWASNVSISVTGPSDYIHTVANTTYGVSYPNASGNAQVPLLLVANQTYLITVTDPAFVPTVGGVAKTIEANVTAYHTMSTRQTLVSAANYRVVEEGQAIVFYLNGTPPPPTESPSAQPTGVPAAAVVGILATVVTAVPLYLWWRQIRARRKEEEKRVTL